MFFLDSEHVGVRTSAIPPKINYFEWQGLF